MLYEAYEVDYNTGSDIRLYAITDRKGNWDWSVYLWVEEADDHVTIAEGKSPSLLYMMTEIVEDHGIENFDIEVVYRLQSKVLNSDNEDS